MLSFRLYLIFYRVLIDRQQDLNTSNNHNASQRDVSTTCLPKMSESILIYISRSAHKLLERQDLKWRGLNLIPPSLPPSSLPFCEVCTALKVQTSSFHFQMPNAHLHKPRTKLRMSVVTLNGAFKWKPTCSLRAIPTTSWSGGLYL